MAWDASSTNLSPHNCLRRGGYAVEKSAGSSTPPPVEDFSVGQDLFEPKGRDVFFVGSYNEDAIVAGDKVLLIKMSGVLEGHSLKDWEEIDVAPLKRRVLAYLQMRGKYRQ